MAGCLWNTEPVKKPLVSVMITLLENMGVEDRTEILGGESQYVCAKSLQLCLTFCNPMDCRLPGSSVHGILQARNTGVGGHDLLQGIFLTQGLNPSSLMSPALGGRFFTTSAT